MHERWSLSELATLTGVSVAVIKSWKHKGLLPPSLGFGPGANYGAAHVERLRKIGEYRAMGYSLEAIGAIVEGTVDPLPTERELKEAGIEKGIDEAKMERVDTRDPHFPDPNVALTNVAKMWGRVKLFEGLELHFEVGRYEVFPSNVKELRDAMEAILCAGDD